jgi:transmembrane sensor
MNRDYDYQATLAIAEQAAEWLEQVPTADAFEGEFFLQWFRQSPVHAREFFLAVRTAERLKHLDAQRLLDVQKLVDAARQNVAPLPLPIQPQAVPPRIVVRQHQIVRPWTLAAVIAFVALLVIATAALHTISGRSLSTAAGESQTLHLSDGSVLRAGPRTHATFAFTDRERVVRLLEGELIIYVVKDRSRPFYVKTDLATARAVGTAFAVRRYKAEPVVVTVQEGSVTVTRASSRGDSAERPSVESEVVSAGEQVRVTARTGPIEARQVDLGKELAWVTGKLQFTRETLSEAIREFNLRNETQIALLSPQVESRAVRGIFDVTDPWAFASSIAIGADLTLVEDQGGTMLLIENTAAAGRAPSEPRSQ